MKKFKDDPEDYGQKKRALKLEKKAENRGIRKYGETEYRRRTMQSHWDIVANYEENDPLWSY